MTSEDYFTEKITGLSFEEVRRAERPTIPSPEDVKTIHVCAHFVMGEQERIVVAGTHGKTTTTGLLIKLFIDAGVEPSFLVGGVVQGESTAYATTEGKSFIIEGDEYDTAYFDKRPKFLHYKPKYLIVTSLELDHTDIYRDEEDYFNAFRYLVEEMPADSTVFLCADNAAASLRVHCQGKVVTYGFSEEADLRMSYGELEGEWQGLNLDLNGESLGEVKTPLTGDYNCLNVACAVGVALENALPMESLRRTIAAFRGMKKRQELLARGKESGVELIDDYAHQALPARKSSFGGDFWTSFEFEP